MKHIFTSVFFLLAIINLFAQINPDSITIVRDKWGVPHIFAKTDAEVAYGLAWANAEDDFKSMQESLLAVRKRLSEVKGKDGAKMDVLSHLIGLDEAVDNAYDTAFSDEFKKILEAYAHAVNDYAKKNPDEILLKKLFPVSSKDIIKGYTMALTFMTHVQWTFAKILKGQFSELNYPSGSNAIAISKTKTADGKTYLAINSHQPLEGPFAWYEAHLCSEEGLNILGGTFPGGVTLFLGANENIAWAHTLNFPDLADVYKLKMHPNEKLKYLFDGKYEILHVRKIKLKVKFGFLKIPVTKTYYWSKYGTTLNYKNDFYSVRFASNMEIRAAEQWYRMNKAQNFSDFEKALRMQGLPGTNIIYADKEGNIFYLDNGLLPYRNPNYEWEKILPGDTSATLWEQKFYPIDSLPHYKNPHCGYLYNTNNTGFHATCIENNLKPENFNSAMGYLLEDNNRSLRLQYLLGSYQKISYENFRKIKYDAGFMNPVYTYMFSNIEDMFHLDEKKYPDIAESIRFIKEWDRTCGKENPHAAILIIAFRYVTDKLFELGKVPSWHKNYIEETLLAEGLRHAQKHLKKYFGTIKIPLGNVQRHIRGNKNLPVAGAPDVLAACYTENAKNGQIKMRAGESYIEMVRFSESGVEIETVNAYGTSAKPDSPHYSDQMEMFVNQQLKPMTLNKEKIFKEAERIYHPK